MNKYADSMPNVRPTWPLTREDIHKHPWIQRGAPKFPVQELSERRLQIRCEGKSSETVATEPARPKTLCWSWTRCVLCIGGGQQGSCVSLLWTGLPQATSLHSLALGDRSAKALRLQTIGHQIRW